METTLTGKPVTDNRKPGSRVQMCGRSDRDGATERDAGCGPEIDAKLTVRVKDASVLGSMLVLYIVCSVLTVWRQGEGEVELGFHDNGSKQLQPHSADSTTRRFRKTYRAQSDFSDKGRKTIVFCRKGR